MRPLHLKIGLDIDGVFASFAPAYQQLFIDYTGKMLFEPGDAAFPPCWNWPEFRGHSKEDVSAVWKAITSSITFWERLAPIQDAVDTLLVSRAFKHDIYWVTSRPGATTKRQTERWLDRHVLPRQTVCVVPNRSETRPVKGLLALGLGLDCYIDDNLDNIRDVATHSPDTRAYLLDCSYNRYADVAGTIRVGSVREMLEREGLL